MNEFLENENGKLPEPEINEVAAKLNKPQKSVKGVIITVISVFCAVCLVFSLLLVSEIKGKKLKSSVNISISQGSSSAQIAEILKDNGLISSAFLFRVYGHLKGYDSSYKYGEYHFEGKNSYDDICKALIIDGGSAKTVTVTIPEGTTINDYTKNVNGENVTVPGIATLLERAGVCKASDFLNALNEISLDSKLLSNVNKENAYVALEGYLFPETYDFYCYDSKECALLAAKKMVAQAESRITEDMYKRAEELGYSMNEILTMASIVQLEAGANTSEMANVAAVFYNRLKTGTPLYSSPTCYYGNAFSFDDGRYDTYKIIGVPPGPLCSPGIDAIKAVLWPTENSPYYYFVTDKNGKFYYNRTLAEHNQTIAKLANEGNWIYEYLD